MRVRERETERESKEGIKDRERGGASEFELFDV